MKMGLSPTQRDVLTRVAAAPGGALSFTDLPKAATMALVKTGRLRTVGASEAKQAAITPSGLQAIGVSPHCGAPDPAAEPAPPPNKSQTKVEILLGLLQAPDGASIAALQAATGWQAHSVRGAIAGTIKKKLGFPVLSEKTQDGRRYRIQTGSVG